MDRIIGANTIDLGGGKRGFRGKDTVAGIAGTELAALWHNAIQEEIVGLVEAAGFAPSNADFAQLRRAMRSGAFNWKVAGGTANALTVDLTPDLAAYAAGLPLLLLTGGAANTDAMTINVDGVGVVPLLRRGGGAMAPGDVPANSLLDIAYDGAAFRCRGIVASDIVAALSAAPSPPQLNFFDLTTQNSQNVGSSVTTVVTDFAVTASKASDAAFSAGGTITIGPKTAGVWAFTQSYVPSQNSGPATTVQAYLQKNGLAIQNQTVSGTFCTNSGVVRVAAGDTLRMAVWQNSGFSQKNQYAPALPLTTTFDLYHISS